MGKTPRIGKQLSLPFHKDAVRSVDHDLRDRSVFQQVLQNVESPDGVKQILAQSLFFFFFKKKEFGRRFRSEMAVDQIKDFPVGHFP